jgi:hypothetical protein
MKRLLLLTPALMITTAGVSFADLPIHVRSVELHRQQAVSLSSNPPVVDASAKTATREDQKRVQPIPPANPDPDNEPLLVAPCSTCHPHEDWWQQLKQYLSAVLPG